MPTNGEKRMGATEKTEYQLALIKELFLPSELLLRVFTM